MDTKQIMKIFEDTAYVHTGGSAEELRCAQYIQEVCAQMGAKAELEAFPMDMGTIHKAEIYADGVSIPCKGYLCCGSGEVEAPLYYLRNMDAYSLSQCAGKIVMIDTHMGYWKYQDLLENGAVGFMIYNGDISDPEDVIAQPELRKFVSKGNKLLAVAVHARSAIDIIAKRVERVRIVVEQDEYEVSSHNVILDLPGDVDEYIVLSAHYDTTSLSLGTYDNMSGCVGLLAMAEHYLSHPHRYGLRFIWCGSEERGLNGSRAYCQAHPEELKKIVLNINLDMIGSIMGKFIACVTAEEQLVSYIRYMASEWGWGMDAYQGVYASDSTPFADNGVPALSFARLAPPSTAKTHTRFDTIAVMSADQMLEDIAFIQAFTDRMVNAKRCPVGREIPDNMKEKLEVYNGRKREKQ